MSCVQKGDSVQISALKRRKSREEKAGYKGYPILYNDELEVYD